MAAAPKEILTLILGHLGFTVTVVEHALDDGILLEVQTDDPGRLIGRQGQTLADLQYLTNRIIFRQDSTAPKVMVDVGNYRTQNRDALLKKANEAAEKVRKFGDIVEMEPLSAFDRRIVHSTLRDDPAVEAYSVEVDGTDKKAMIFRPKRQAD